MALAHVHLFSQTLGMSCSINVVIPQVSLIPLTGRKRPDGKLPVLYLLHGASDDHTAWQRHTAIERYAEALGLAVVMPGADLSFYTNMASGGAYFEYIAGELPAIAVELFPVSDRREDTFIAGTSMGGYGALKIGLSRPERFSAIGCFSLGAFMHAPPGDLVLNPPVRRWLNLAFGVEDTGRLLGTEHDPIALADRAMQEGKPLPRIFHVCGQDDDPQILDVARRTRALLQARPIDYSYFEGPGGHTWDFWDEWIQKFLMWLVD